MSLKNSTTEELLTELQSRHDCGVVGCGAPDSDANLYVWWGSRVFALGLAARLTHGLNVELEEGEEGTSESGSIDADADRALDALAQEFPQQGMYL